MIAEKRQYLANVAKGLSPVLIGLAIIVLIGRTVLFTAGRAPKREKNLEEIVVEHQFAAARSATGFNVLLVGDSSCLMDLDAKAMKEDQHRFLNLGMVSVLPLSSFGDIVHEYAARNPGQPETVVLLIHPEMMSIEGDFSAVRLSEAKPFTAEEGSKRVRFLEWSGILPLQERTLERVLPQPLPGKYGEFYGFDRSLQNFLDENGGSAIDPGAGNVRTARYERFRITDVFRKEAAEFRERIPRNCELLIGLAPVPEGAAPENYDYDYVNLLSELSGLVDADGILRLPATLPNVFFATPTHLRAEGRAIFTREFLETFDAHHAGEG